nr:hypothetical protein [Tanacetum cinerariifolium]
MNDNTTLSSVPTLENNLAGDFSPALLMDSDNKMKQHEKMKRMINARTEYAKGRGMVGQLGSSGNPQHALKDKGVIDSGCSRHTIGNMSYLSDFAELNGGYVGFGGNPRVNNDGDAAFDGKEHDFDAKKPESKVNVSPSSSAQTRKQDDKTKKEAKGKSLVESLTRYRDLNAEFKGCFDDSIKEVNIAGFIVSIVGQISPNSTNIFRAAGPSNVAASPTYGNSSFMDASQLPDDPDMLELEDIIYSDDDDDVGAEADFNNLETSITVSPIPTTRVHKDHHISQIIGDLSSTTQTRSMIRMDKEQCGLSQMFDDDFHTCMFACFLSQEEPKRVMGNSLAGISGRGNEPYPV